MADVDMPDAGPSALAKSKVTGARAARSGAADAGSDGKKRFEVKKVWIPHWSQATWTQR